MKKIAGCCNIACMYVQVGGTVWIVEGTIASCRVLEVEAISTWQSMVPACLGEETKRCSSACS